MAVVILGQSNEAGVGDRRYPDTPLAVQQEPVRPSGGHRSMWPLLEQLAAERGVRIAVWNSAVGSSSLVHSWAGVIEQWKPHMIVTRGTYVLYDGRVYKCVSPPPYNSLYETKTPPVGTGSFTTPDTVDWQYMGPARPQDVPNHVYTAGDAYFDPNGYLAEAFKGFSMLPPGEHWMFISLGQTDAGSFWDVTREQFRSALIAVTRYALARKVKVAIGFTVYRANPFSEKNYQLNLLPGRQDALDYFKGDPRVVPGANLRDALGVLPSDPPSGPGLKKGIHMNDDAYTLASRAWFEQLLKDGLL